MIFFPYKTINTITDTEQTEKNLAKKNNQRGMNELMDLYIANSH